MSFRDKLKQNFKEFQEDVKELFHRPGTSRPGIPSSLHASGSLAVGGENSHQNSDKIIRDHNHLSFQSTSPAEQHNLGAARPTGNVLQTGPEGSSANVSKLINQTTTGSRAVGPMSGMDKTNQHRSDKTLPPPGQTPEAIPQTTSVMWKGAKELAKVLQPVAHIFGPVKEVVDMIIGCIDQYEVAEAAEVEYNALQVQVGGLLEDLARFFGEDPSLAVTPSIEGICRSIRAELEVVQSRSGKNVGARYFGAPDEVEVILGCYRRIHSHLQRLSLNANLEMWKVVEEQASGTRLDRMSSLVDRLPSSLSACYNSSEGAGLKRRSCTPGTRLNVLAFIQGWASNTDGGAVYWLNGMAGTGKTTIAYSICDRLTAERKLAASFFCSRLRGECRDVNLIFPSIAYQLARFSRPFMSALSEILKQDPDVHTRLLHLQFEALISKPLKQAGGTLPDGLVVVIDALDECDDKDSTRIMLDLLLSEATSLPIRFIVSSRPEPEIRDEMSERSKSRLVLHELSKDEVQTDIKKYLREGLRQMNPSEGQVDAIAEKAGILFIYAATAVRYISYDNFKRNPTGRLRTILNGSRGQGTAENKDIDQLYMTILEAAFSDPELDKASRTDMERVLRTVICAREPLTVNAISELLLIGDAVQVQAALRPLWSVLHVVEASELVTTLHASFADFMFDPTRSKQYHCDRQAHHLVLAELCFDCVKRTRSRINICGLESSYVFDENIPNMETRVAEGIPLELLYACRFWAAHVGAGECASSVIERLRDFLSTRLPLWMEVLNLNKQMTTGTECMKLTVDLCRALEGEQDLIDLAQDAKRFVETFASNPVSQSTPHLYVSMLAFWPKSSPIAKHYATYTRGPVEPEGTALDRRQPAHLSTWTFEKGIGGMAISPDGLCIALRVGEDVVLVDSSSGRKLLEPLRCHPDTSYSISFSPDGASVLVVFGPLEGNYVTISGWDTRSGDVVLAPLELQGHTGSIRWFGFSPDCSRIATVADDNTIHLWDVQSGNMLHRFSAQGEILDIAFAPDGTQLAAGWGTTLQAWDTHTGRISLGPLTHECNFSTLAFTPDGLRIISASSDNDDTIYVWDSQNGKMILGPIGERAAAVIRIECSPDGKCIASSYSDRTICVWDIERGNMVLGPLEGHKAWISSVAFTPDGSRIISGCARGLVCTWDAQQRNLAPSSTATANDHVKCVKFSPDGTRFVSGSSEGGVSIWDAHTGDQMFGPIRAHYSRIREVDFLKDRFVSGADDGTICVCDALTGEVVLGPLQVGSLGIKSIAYSPDGQIIATGSEDGVHGWNAQNGGRVFGPLTGLGGEVISIKFSPDGTRIVGSAWASQANLAVWNVPTGENVFGTLGGHSRFVLSASYSPNGALIASSSSDETIIIWDAYTGKKRFDPLTGYSTWVWSIQFSPDSTRLLAGSDDGAIRIWDVQTGEMMFEFLAGHEHYINSVEYSPDGTRILSCSDHDMSMRIHDARNPAERALSRSESDIGDWTVNKDGWVVDDQSRLLVWVPGDLRKALMHSETQLMVGPDGYVRLKFDKSRMGESWAEGFTFEM